MLSTWFYKKKHIIIILYCVHILYYDRRTIEDGRARAIASRAPPSPVVSARGGSTKNDSRGRHESWRRRWRSGAATYGRTSPSRLRAHVDRSKRKSFLLLLLLLISFFFPCRHSFTCESNLRRRTWLNVRPPPTPSFGRFFRASQ